MTRYLPIAAIAAAALLVLIVVVSSGGGGGAQTAQNAAPAKHAKHAAPKAKPAPTPYTGPTGKVKGPHDDPVPILMYHETAPPPAGTPYPDLWVSPADFTGQMNWLAKHGYTAITEQQLFNYWDKGYALPKKPVVASFDDGYEQQYKYAAPVLAAHHWPGVLNLEWNNVSAARTGFTAKMVRSMIAAGWEIDSHTISHPDLTTLGAQQLKFELEKSKARIKRKYGVPADFFCYPAGKYDATVIDAVKAAGYKGATTELPGVARRGNPYELQRIRIDGSDGVAGFAAKMRQVAG